MIDLNVTYMGQVKVVAEMASETVSVDPSATAQDLVHQLAERFGDAFRRLVLDKSGRLNGAVLLFKGDEQVMWDTPVTLAAGDKILFMSAIAGG